jgi:hypothetical protein
MVSELGSWSYWGLRWMVRVSATVSTFIGFVLLPAERVTALPPPEDLPEEVLRTEIILDARSPITGEPLTPQEYAELQAQFEAAPNTLGRVSPEVRRIVGLLRLRRALRTIFPFIP